MKRPIRGFWAANIRIITLEFPICKLTGFSVVIIYWFISVCFFVCFFCSFFLLFLSFVIPTLYSLLLLFTFNVTPSLLAGEAQCLTSLEMRMLLQRTVQVTTDSSVPWRPESHWAKSQKYAMGPTCSCAAAESIFCLAWSAVDEDTDTAMFCLSHLMSSHMQDNCKNRSTSTSSCSQHLQKQKWY